MDLFNRPKHTKPSEAPVKFKLTIEPLFINYSGQDVELVRKKICDKFADEFHISTSFDYLNNWIQAELNQRFQSIEADRIFSKIPAISKLEPTIIAMALKLNYVDDYFENIELNSEADWEAAKQVATRLRTLEVKVRIDMELLMFVASGEQQTVAPKSRSEMPAVGLEDVVFPLMDPLPEPLGQQFPPAAPLWFTSSAASQSTSLAEDPRAEELVASASANQQGAEQLPRSALDTALPQLQSTLISSSPRAPEPMAANASAAPDAALCDATTDTHEDHMSMERLRTMKMADLAQMLVGQTQSAGASIASLSGFEAPASLRLEGPKPVCSRCYLPYERREEQLCERCSAAAAAAAATGGDHSSLIGEEERAERVPVPLGLCKHGAPSCCERCVGNEHKKHRTDKCPASGTQVHKRRERHERASASSSSPSLAAEAAEADSSSPSIGVGVESCARPALAASKRKPKVALRAKLANTSAKAVASLDAYIRREEKRLGYWSDKFNQCDRILSGLPVDSMIRREFEPLLWQKRSECELQHELLGLCRVQFDQHRLEHAALSKSSQTPSDELIAEAKRHQLSTEDLLRLPIILDGTHMAPLGLQSEEQVRLVLRQVEAMASSLRQLLAPAIGRVFPQVELRADAEPLSGASPPSSLCSAVRAPDSPKSLSLQPAPAPTRPVERTLAELELPSFVLPEASSLLQAGQLAPADRSLTLPTDGRQELSSIRLRDEATAMPPPQPAAELSAPAPDEAAGEAIDGQPDSTEGRSETEIAPQSQPQPQPVPQSSMPTACESREELTSKSSGEPEPESEAAESESESEEDTDEEFELLKLEDASPAPAATDKSHDVDADADADADAALSSAALEESQPTATNGNCGQSRMTSTDGKTATCEAAAGGEPSTGAPESLVVDATIVGGLAPTASTQAVTSPRDDGERLSIAPPVALTTSGAVQLLISSTDSHACEEVLCSTGSGSRIALQSALAESEEAKSTVSAPVLSESETSVPPLPVPRTIRCISPCELEAPAAAAAAPSTSASSLLAESESATSEQSEQVKPLPVWAATIRNATEPAIGDALQQPRWQPTANASNARSRLGPQRVEPVAVLPLREVIAPGSRESLIAARQLELITMGFANREMNRRALEESNLDINGAVNWLVDHNDNNWSVARH